MLKRCVIMLAWCSTRKTVYNARFNTRLIYGGLFLFLWNNYGTLQLKESFKF